MCAVSLRQVPSGVSFRLAPDSTTLWTIIRKLPDRWGRVRCEAIDYPGSYFIRDFHIERIVYINDNLLR